MLAISTTVYSQGEVAAATGYSAQQIFKLTAAMLRKKGRGKGHHNLYTFDDALRIALAKELRRSGVAVPSLQSLFGALDTPPPSSPSKPWSWLKTAEARTAGATIVLFIEHRLGGRKLPTGVVYLTTAQEAVGWLRSKTTVTVIDVNAVIAELEERTGEQYV